LLLLLLFIVQPHQHCLCFSASPAGCQIRVMTPMSPIREENGGYSVSLPTSYRPGESYKIQVSGGENFKGYMLFATDSAGKRAGSFNPTNKKAQLMKCEAFGDLGNTIGHTLEFARASQNAVEFVWTSPLTDRGVLTFEGMVVRDARNSFRLTSVAVASPTVAVVGGSSTVDVLGGKSWATAQFLQTVTFLGGLGFAASWAYSKFRTRHR